MAEFSYNNREHSTTNMSPFQANNLSRPRWNLETKTENMTHPAGEEHLKEMKDVETELKACLDMTADKMKELYNKGEIPELQPGDKVFLEAKNIKEKIQAKDEPTRLMTKKLRKKRIGPFEVLRKIGDLTYQLLLSDEMNRKGVHDTFHISLLTKAPKDTIKGRIPPMPKPIIVDSEEEMEVEEVIDSRIRNKQLQYLVKWKDMSPAENSWEPALHLKNAPEAVSDFHKHHPEAPRRLNATTFINLPWRKLENYTILEKKRQIQKLLHSRDLVP